MVPWQCNGTTKGKRNFPFETCLLLYPLQLGLTTSWYCVEFYGTGNFNTEWTTSAAGNCAIKQYPSVTSNTNITSIHYITVNASSPDLTAQTSTSSLNELLPDNSECHMLLQNCQGGWGFLQFLLICQTESFALNSLMSLVEQETNLLNC